ncbi:uncharacterized protein LOC133035538 [Cannabis sativa]|uniref:uncharacterized protein LOC133035538 n=1 Tax=Cannabis sativa TaxID=3483 RepID=UPI0029C9DF6C|nr:uncharacterized protein LOC133035538 [Cannabis sativa]
MDLSGHAMCYFGLIFNYSRWTVIVPIIPTREGFSSLIQKTEVNRALHGYYVVHGPPSITHMLFADDNYLFCQGTTGAASSVVNLLRVSEGASGQKIIIAKSNVFSSPNTENSLRQSICKEILLKTIIQSLPTYAMSVFLLIIGTCHEIEEAMARFWWKPNSSKGKGSSTSILNHPWLPDRANRFVTTVHPSLLNQNVCSLLSTESRSWDRDLVFDMFNARDANLILGIPLSLNVVDEC